MDEQIQGIQHLIEQNKIDEAIAEITKLPETVQRSGTVCSMLGIISIYCGKFDDAEGYLKLAVAENPKDVDALFNLAYVYATQGKLHEFAHVSRMMDQADFDEDTFSQIEEWKKALYRSRPQKKVLMIAYYFPPLSGSGVFRSLKFAKYLQEYGWKPTVISAVKPPESWNYRDDTLLEEIPENIEVIRIADNQAEKNSAPLSKEEIEKTLSFQHEVFSNDLVLGQMYQSILAMENGVEYVLNCPDEHLNWAMHVAEYIDEHLDISQFDVLYTSCAPINSALLGFFLKQKYHIRWVSDYRDAIILNPYSELDMQQTVVQMVFLLERLLLQYADINIIVADTQINEYRKLFSLPKERITSIANGYDEDDFSALKPTQKKTEKFVITYSGLLYTQFRDIFPLIAAVRELIDEGTVPEGKILIQCIGNSCAPVEQYAKELGMANVMACSGEYVPHREALQSNLDSNMLVMLVGDGKRFRNVYTGKLFDYLRSGRQILAIAPSDGVVGDVLHRAGYGYTVQSCDAGRIKALIKFEYKKWERFEETPHYYHTSIRRFERSHLTGQLADVLERAARGGMEFSSAIYDQEYEQGGAGGSYHKHYSQSQYYAGWKMVMDRMEELAKASRILEIGCGTGQFAQMIYDHGFTDYRGVDFSAEAISQAKRRLPEWEDRFFKEDAFCSSLIAESYDLIVCFEVLEHLEKDIELLNRIQPGTRMIFSVPNFPDLTHVRCFETAEEVKERYSAIVDIDEIKTVYLREGFCLYYVMGQKR